MSQQSIKVDAGTGSPVDFSQTTGANYRQVVSIGDPTTDANYVTVANGAANIVGTVSISNSPTITLGAASNVVGSVSIVGSVPVTFSGTQNITGTITNLSAGTVQAIQSGVWTVQPGNTPNTTAWLTQVSAGTITNLSAGTVQAVQSGTWNVGTVSNLSAGTVQAIQSGAWNVTGTVTAISSGTITSISGAESSTMWNGNTALQPTFFNINFSGVGDNVVVGTTSSKRIRVIAMSFIVGTATNFYLGDSNGGNLWGSASNPGNFAANSGIVLPYCPQGYFQTGAGNALIANISATSQVAGALTYLTI